MKLNMDDYATCDQLVKRKPRGEFFRAFRFVIICALAGLCIAGIICWLGSHS